MSLKEIAGELRIGIEGVRRFLGIERLAPIESGPDGYVEDLKLAEGFDFGDQEPALSGHAVAAVRVPGAQAAPRRRDALMDRQHPLAIRTLSR